jgi:uncharacterized membrane protein
MAENPGSATSLRDPLDSTLHLVLATVVFLGLHVVPSTPLRPLAVRLLGEGPYLGLFSLASLAGLGWMVYAYKQAAFFALWPGLHLLPVFVMPLAFVLLACGVLARNPMLAGQAGVLRHPEAARGILRVTRHPVMWAIMLWSGSHLLAIGSLQGAILFGGLFLLAAAGTALQDARKAAQLGDDWRRFAARTSNLPFAAIAQGRNVLSWREIGWRNPAIGLVLFGVLLYCHAWLFGMRAY